MNTYKKINAIMRHSGAIFLLLMMLFHSSVFAQQTSLVPTDDAYVEGGVDELTNFGTETIIKLKEAAGPDFKRRAYFKFDLSGIPVDTDVSSATLSLYVKRNTGGTGSNLYVRSINDDSWDEGTLNWTNVPAAVDTIVTIVKDDLSSIGADERIAIDVTSYFTAEFAGDKTMSLSLTVDNTRNLDLFTSDTTLVLSPLLIIKEPAGAGISGIMGSCDFNDGAAEINAYNASEAIQAAGLSYTRIGIKRTFYMEGSTVKPEVIDDIVVLLYNEGIQPMLIVEHNPDDGALPDEATWSTIGAAFAERFSPNSAFLTSQGISNWGIRQYQAINEPFVGVNNPLIDPYPFPIDDYIGATRGFANGVHSVNAELEVSPGGFQETPLFLDRNVYMPGLATMFNDGTLDAIDIHRYYERGGDFDTDNKTNSHQALVDSVKAEYGITASPKVWCTEYNARQAGSDIENAKDFVTVTWDLLTVTDGADNFVSDFALTFRTYLPVSANENLGMAESAFPFLGNPKGVAHQMLANITQGVSLVSKDEDKGLIVLEGDDKKMWVWHNRAAWSNMNGTSVTIDNIPAFAGVLEVFRYNSWNASAGATGTPNPSQTLDVNAATSLLVEGLVEGETYMFVAKPDASFNVLPVATITSPNTGETFVEGDNTALTVEVSDTDGVDEVVFYAGSIRLGEDKTAPYTVDLQNMAAGNTEILVIAKDTKGAVNTATLIIPIEHPDQSANIIAVADAYVKGGQTADDNFGDTENLLVKKSGGENLTRRSYLKFNIDPSQEGVPVATQAILRFKVSRPGDAEQTVSYVPDDTWTETGITWNNKPDATVKLGTFTPVDEGQWVEIDVTNQVIAEQAGDGVLSLLLNTEATPLVEFFSKEALPGNEPRLILKSPGDITPQVTFTFPEAGREYKEGEEIVVKANAITTDGATIEKVDFFIGDSLYVSDTAAPYNFSTVREEGGIFEVRGVATDSNGESNEATLELSVSFGGIVFNPVADTYVRGGGNSANNFGNDPSIFVKRGGGAASPFAEPATREGYIKFDLTSLEEEVTSAELRLHLDRNDGGDIPELSINLYHIDNDEWEEEVITWDTKPVARDVLIASDDSIANYSDDGLDLLPAGSIVSFDITAAVQAEKASGNGILSLALISFGNRNIEFASKENGSAANVPVLLLNAGAEEESPLTRCKGDDCTNGLVIDYTATGRYGNNLDEIVIEEASIIDAANGIEIVEAREGFVWTSGQVEDFALDYSKETGKVSYTLGNKSLTWDHKTNLSQQAIIAYADASGAGNEVFITDLIINDQEYEDVYATEDALGLKVLLANPADAGLSVTGKVTLTWAGAPVPQAPLFSIIVSDTTTQTILGLEFPRSEMLTVYPNPIKGDTKISYQLAAQSNVQIVVSDVQGRVVSNVDQGSESAGTHTHTWNALTKGRSIKKGIYFIKVLHDKGQFSQRIILLNNE